jgi:hypothetical protein
MTEQKISDLRETEESYKEFFAREKLKLEDQIEFLKSQIYTWLESVGKKSLKTPVGLVSCSTRTRTIWPSDEELLVFAKAMGIPIKTKESVSKKDVQDYLKDTGNASVLPGYDQETISVLSIRQYDIEPEKAPDIVGFESWD